ncbi:MAG: O-antigen ligase [Hoeflea sp.]|uniref:O-antigen ligase family protein n=1 Tax=Hoeflea sp. TaxID=1940281 RepID=UPI003299F9DC
MRHVPPSFSGQPGHPAWAPLQSGLQLARPDILSPGVIRGSAIILSALGLALMLISLRPFVGASMISEAGVDEGSALNQYGFLAAGLIFALSVMCLASRQALVRLLTPGFLLLGMVLVYNVVTSPEPMQALRAVVLTVIGMFIAFSVMVLPRGEKDFQTALIAATLATLALSYGGLIAFPNLATHGYDAYEPQHAGLWRGHFSHKNIAGPVMCVIAIFGVYLIRSGQRFIGLIIFAAGALFVVNTGSKTTSGLFPVAILIVFSATIFGRSAAAILLTVMAIAGTYVLTIGSLSHPRISYLILDILGDETYTGRTTLWEFSLSKIPEKPWLGYGLYNFWSTGNVRGLEKPFEAAWDYRYIIHGHNNYLDILLNLGVIGGSVLFWVLFVGPMFNYARARRIPGNRKLADMFFMIIVFMSLLSFLETFFLARNDPIWLMHIFAVLGLHLLARFDISAGSNASAAPPGRRFMA